MEHLLRRVKSECNQLLLQPLNPRPDLKTLECSIRLLAAHNSSQTSMERRLVQQGKMSMHEAGCGSAESCRKPRTCFANADGL